MPNIFSTANHSQTDASSCCDLRIFLLPFHSLPQMVDLHFYVSLPQTVGEDSPSQFCVLGSQSGSGILAHKPRARLGNAMKSRDAEPWSAHLGEPRCFSCGVGTRAVLGQGLT